MGLLSGWVWAGGVWIEVWCAMAGSGHGWAAGRKDTSSQRFAELENRDGGLNTHRRRWGPRRASACLQAREDAVDEVGCGDDRDELHFCAALGALERVHLEDFSE